MRGRRGFSRRDLLRGLAGAGVITAADLLWWDEPFGWPRKARAAASPVRFQLSVPEPLRVALLDSLVQRYNKTQSDVEVAVDFVPQAQARQKLVAAVAARNPPDCCQVWDTWLGELDRLGVVEDLTPRVKEWSRSPATLPVAWQTVTVNGRVLSLPWALTNDAVFVRADRVKDFGLKLPDEHWTWDDFLALARGLTRPDRNQYGFGMRGVGAWAVLYATEFLYGNGAQVVTDGAVAINSPEAVSALAWYIDLLRKHRVTPPGAATDGYRQIVEGFGRGVTGTYLHNSGSAEEQKKALGEKNVVTLPLPLGPAKKRASFCFSETLAMPREARNQEGAWKFMTWLMDDEPNYHYCTTLGLLPTRQALADRPHYRHPGYQGFIKSLPFSIISPYRTCAGWGGKLESDGVPLLQQAMLGRIGPKECLDRFAEVLATNME
jgi:multiple sugar transport system substrate-binding protein